jgi:hypothetical protein
VAIVAGDFYTGSVYPSSYQNALFLSDFGDNELRVLRTNANGTLNSVTAVGLDIGAVVEMSMGRDGYLYLVDLAEGKVSRLLFTPASASLMAAEPPTSADLSGDGVVDGADFLAWQRSDDGSAAAAASLEAWKADFGSVTASSANASVESEANAAEAFDADIYWLAFEEHEESTVTAAIIEEPATSVLAPIVAFNAPLTVASSDDQDSPSGEESIDEAFDAWAEDVFDFADSLLAVE